MNFRNKIFAYSYSTINWLSFKTLLYGIGTLPDEQEAKKTSVVPFQKVKKVQCATGYLIANCDFRMRWYAVGIHET